MNSGDQNLSLPPRNGSPTAERMHQYFFEAGLTHQKRMMYSFDVSADDDLTITISVCWFKMEHSPMNPAPIPIIVFFIHPISGNWLDLA